MKKTITLCFLILVNTFLFAQSDKESPFLTKTFSSENIQSVESKTSGGNITVEGNASDFHVDVYVNNNHGKAMSSDEITKRMEDYDLQVAVENHSLKAIAKQKNKNTDWKNSLSISFKIYVPQNVSTDLSTSGGNIMINNLSGTQNFTTSGGNLSISSITGSVHGRTSGGNVHVENSSNDIDLETSGGNIEAQKCEGNIKLETSGGNLQLQDLKGTIKSNTSGGNIDAENISGELVSNTSGGNINLKNLSASLETSTSGGSINVLLTSLGKYVTIKNSGGNINLQLPKGQGIDLDISGDKINSSGLNNFNGSTMNNTIVGKLNGGGIPVKVNAGGGKVNLNIQ